MRIFHSPENTRVVESDIELVTAKAIIRGRRVPRSPKDPEISDIGDLLSVATLLACRSLILSNAIDERDSRFSWDNFYACVVLEGRPVGGITKKRKSVAVIGFQIIQNLQISIKRMTTTFIDGRRKINRKR